MDAHDIYNLSEAYQAVHAPREISEEQVWEEVESWVNSLLSEGYDLSDYTWEDLYEYYVSEGYKRMNRGKIERQAQRLGGERGEVLRTIAKRMNTTVERMHSTSQARKNRAGGAGSDYRKRKELQARDDAKADIEKYGLYGDKKETNEQLDLYDIILSHLLDEGYAESQESAEAIMVNMSEDWKDSILDEANRAEKELELTSRQRERARNLHQYTSKPIFYDTNPNRRKKADNSDPILNKAHKGMTAKRQRSHKEQRGQSPS